MGHWAEQLVDELAQRLDGEHDRAVLLDVLVRTGRRIDMLAGRSFHAPRQTTSTFVSNGLPFVDVPDLLIGSTKSVEDVWPVPDWADPARATVLQIMRMPEPLPTAVPRVEALWIAGQIITQASRDGRLSKDYVLGWLGETYDSGQREKVLRQVLDPAVRFSVPVFGLPMGGWWIQVSRRLLWVTADTEDEGRLLEPLLTDLGTDGKAPPLVAVEPILIAAPLTRQPVETAFVARLWNEGVQRSSDGRWPMAASAIHGHGIPTITLDPASTPHEVACQLVLKGYWHGFIDSGEPALANAIAMAYPREVQRVQHGTRAPSIVAAAATLLEQLIRPGFDPSQGAEAMRRYVRRKASIVVMEHRKSEAPDRYPWTQVGISERRYYKLLPQFAQKVNGRYDFDQSELVQRMRAYLDQREKDREIRAAALELLRSRGFSNEAARKWLQRHPPDEAVKARPRHRSPSSIQ